MPTHILRTDEMDAYRNEGKTLESVLDLLLGKSRSIRIDNGDEIGRKYGIYRLEISADGHGGDYFRIDSIRMETKGDGRGTAVMERICEWADKNNVVLTLTPSDSYGASSVGRLVSFYKKFGFVSNKGRHADYNTMQSMYRVPSR